MKGILHAGITVRNLDASIAFYRDILGLELVKREAVRKARGEKLGVPGAVIQVAVLRTDSPDTNLELIEYLEPKPDFEEQNLINKPGTIHLAFQVDNIAEMVEDMKKKGVVFVSPDYEEIKDGPLKGMKWIYFKDPDEANLELIQYDPED